MLEFIIFMRDFFNDCTDLLRIPRFDIGGYEVAYFDLMWTAIIVGMLISAFWKGARSSS